MATQPVTCPVGRQCRGPQQSYRTYRITDVCNRSEVWHRITKLLRPSFRQALFDGDLREQPAVHDCELSSDLERIYIEELDLLQTSRYDSWRACAGRSRCCHTSRRASQFLVPSSACEKVGSERDMYPSLDDARQLLRRLAWQNNSERADLIQECIIVVIQTVGDPGP